MRVFTTFLFLSLLVSSGATLQAQTTPTVPASPSIAPGGGTEFWVVFQKNFRDYVTDDRTLASKPADSLTLALVIASSVEAHGTVEIPGIKFRKEFTVAPGAITRVPIDTAAQLRSSEVVEHLAAHVTSDRPVVVYGIDSRFQTTDTYFALPMEALGTSYRAAGYRWLQSDLLSQVAVIATEDGTRLSITPTAATQKGHPAGAAFEVTLNRGEVYQVIPRYNPKASSDLTGTLIESDRLIAVFSGHNCAYVPDPRVKACNLLVEQIPPMKSWGRRFAIGTLGLRSSSVVRVIAAEDGTRVAENDSTVATLRAGEFYENANVTKPMMITSDRRVMVTQYSKGFDNGDDVGDPMMIVIPPIERYLTSHSMATVMTGSWHHYVNVAAPARALGSVAIDGKRVADSLFKPIGAGEYAVAAVEVPYGMHQVSCSEPIGIYTYGFGFDMSAFDAYGSAGMYLINSADQ
jgi:hypothetical protein